VTELQATTSGKPAVSFGPFRLVAAQRLLLEGDKPVRLGGRAFDILAALVERAGEVVSKEELIARAWPATFVEEANLKIQVSALRRALGDGQGDNRYVATVVGRGYIFVAPTRKEEPSRTLPSPIVAPAALHNLPFATTRMIGREEIATTLVTQLSHRRLVTVVGPGGIGKTTVGLGVAERMIGAYEHGVWMVDLAPLRDPGLVPSAVATVLGLEIRTEDPMPALVAALRDDRMLLMLDNCEHVIDAAAGLAAAVISGAPGVNILATSREPLGVQGERVHRLGPLNSPEPSPELTATEAAAFPAVQLFVERVSAIVEDFALTDANAALVAAICRRLDGLPLAIEFAAPRVEVLGIEGLAARLHDSLRLLGTQRRAAMPRHWTMQVVIDWSYGLLSEGEQRFFRELGIFAGAFTAESAAAVVTDATTAGADAIDRLTDLVAKSLVVADVSGAKPRFRLLDTTRAFAIEKLDASGERERIARRHAEYFRDLFARAETELKTRPAAEWRADYLRQIDDLRVALDWSFSANDEASTGVALTAAAVPLWMQLSLMEECRDRVRQALTALTSGVHLDARIEMILNAALGASLTYSIGPVPETVAAWLRTLRLAEDMDDPEYRLRALRGLWSYRMNVGEYPAALALADEFRDLAERQADWATVRAGNRMSALILHYLGERADARKRIESITRTSVAASPAPPTARLMVDPDVAAPALLARILWLQGFPDQATRTAEIAVRRARSADHTISMCHALAQAACPVALWTGDLLAAEGFVATLADLASRHALGGWIARARCFEGALLISQGQVTRGAAIIQSTVPRMGAAGSVAESPAFLAVLAHGRRLARQLESGLAAINEALERSESTGERWCEAELLRIKGELMLSPGTPDRSAAEEYYRRALEQARRQGALGWELRAATSLARLLHDQDGSSDAKMMLQTVYDRFTEGFDTADLIAAKLLLDDLRVAGHR
jgi:predicted ATPase/DNA-binding winged helix-turn-helix (wHTH) protein